MVANKKKEEVSHGGKQQPPWYKAEKKQPLTGVESYILHEVITGLEKQNQQLRTDKKLLREQLAMESTPKLSEDAVRKAKRKLDSAISNLEKVVQTSLVNDLRWAAEILESLEVR